MAEHTPTPWRYRPREFDDWGFIRGPDDVLAAVAKYGACTETSLDQHRHNRTDPAEANAAFVVKAVNNHDALVDALASVRAEINLSKSPKLAAKIDAVLGDVGGSGNG
jgi:hypothetical protein